MVMVVTAAGLENAEGGWLVQQRPPGKPLAGLWEFPGGKVDPGETPEAALVRELAEELGITVDPQALAPILFSSALVGDRALVLLFYRVSSWHGTPSALHAADLRWVRADALNDLPMPEPDRPLVDAIVQGWPSRWHGG